MVGDGEEASQVTMAIAGCFLCCISLPVMVLVTIFLALGAYAVRQILVSRTARDPKRRTRAIALLAFAVATPALTCALAVAWVWRSRCLEAPYSNPPRSFQDSDLVGTWETHYGRSLDRLIIREDGTFRQLYQSGYAEDYAYETPWNEWSLDRFSNGTVRLHLQGARYYRDGIEIGELDGMGDSCPADHPDFCSGEALPPRPFYDPVAERSLQMAGKLVLDVRSDSSGDILLFHLWPDGRGDQGHPIFDCDSDVFRRVTTP